MPDAGRTARVMEQLLAKIAELESEAHSAKRRNAALTVQAFMARRALARANDKIATDKLTIDALLLRIPTPAPTPPLVSAPAPPAPMDNTAPTPVIAQAAELAPAAKTSTLILKKPPWSRDGHNLTGARRNSGCSDKPRSPSPARAGFFRQEERALAGAPVSTVHIGMPHYMGARSSSNAENVAPVSQP